MIERFGQCVVSVSDRNLGTTAGHIAVQLILKNAKEQLEDGYEVVGLEQQDGVAGGPTGTGRSTLTKQEVGVSHSYAFQSVKLM